MHTRRFVAFLLGVWLVGMVLVAYISHGNLSTTQGIVESGGEAARRHLEMSGRENSIPLLRHNTAEINRSMVQSWEWMQLGLGLVVLCTLPFAMRLQWSHLIAAALMLLIVIAQRALLTPEMIGVGRLLDFVSPGAQEQLAKQRNTLSTLQMLYSALEIVKGSIGLGLTVVLLVFKQKSSLRARGGTRVRRENSDTIDDADYSHVDGRVGTAD